MAASCATAPFLADRRIVIVRDVGRFSSEELAPLLSYLEDPLPTTVLLLAGGGGTVPPRLLSAVKAAGRVQSTRVSLRDARDWIRGRLRAAPVRLDAQAEAVIEVHLGQDINRVGALLEVLSAAYGDGARLNAADVQPYLGEAGSVAPWDLTDAIDGGRTADALDSLHRLLGGGERHPLVVLALLHRHLQTLLRLDDPSVRSESAGRRGDGYRQGAQHLPGEEGPGLHPALGVSTHRRGHTPGCGRRTGSQGRQRLSGDGRPRGAGRSAVPPGTRLRRRVAGRVVPAAADPMHLSVLDYLAATGAAGAAGLINAVAGGGTLVSFPTLVAIGVPAVAANVTNTVALLPGYLAGSWAQRDDLRPQLRSARPLAVAALFGGLGGSLLLINIPATAFRVAIPYLILASCVLLWAQDLIREWLRPSGAGPPGPSPPGGPGPAGRQIPLGPGPFHRRRERSTAPRSSW